MVMEKDTKFVIEQFVDFLMPELTPYESSVYLLLLRSTFIKDGSREIRIGKRTITEKYGRGSRGIKTNYAHISEVLKKLEERKCVEIVDTNVKGTLYTVFLPDEIPLVLEKLNNANLKSASIEDEDFFINPEKRNEIFERDKWTCFYCGEKVTVENATLDHLIPQHKGGKNNKENLKTCCFICNSLKSGKTYEEAAPVLLKSIQQRRAK